MKELFLLMNVVFFGYLSFITLRYGIQTSVSESYYRLPRNWQWVFTIITWAYALPAMIIGLDLTANGLVFLSGIGIAFVGAAPAFKSLKLERAVHTVGALVGIIGMMIFLSVIGYWYLVLLFTICSYLMYEIDRVNAVWWAESFAFITLSFAYSLMLFF